MVHALDHDVYWALLNYGVSSPQRPILRMSPTMIFFKCYFHSIGGALCCLSWCQSVIFTWVLTNICLVYVWRYGIKEANHGYQHHNTSPTSMLVGFVKDERIFVDWYLYGSIKLFVKQNKWKHEISPKTLTLWKLTQSHSSFLNDQITLHKGRCWVVKNLPLWLTLLWWVSEAN